MLRATLLPGGPAAQMRKHCGRGDAMKLCFERLITGRKARKAADVPIALGQIGRQNEAVDDSRDHTHLAGFPANRGGGRAKPCDPPAKSHPCQFLTPRRDQAALAVSSARRNPPSDDRYFTQRRLLLCAADRGRYIAVFLCVSQRGFRQSDRHDRSFVGHARRAAHHRRFDLSGRQRQLYFPI